MAKTPDVTTVRICELEAIAKRRQAISSGVRGIDSQTLQTLVSWDQLQQRRENASDVDAAAPAKSLDQFAYSCQLVGLALSGGGIRSAAFNLGFLQASSHEGLLPFCDYLSTVSGGGYIGTCLTFLAQQREKIGPEARTFPLAKSKSIPDHSRGEESDTVTRIRQKSSYLIGQPELWSVDVWRAVSAYALGVIVTTAVLSSFVMSILSGYTLLHVGVACFRRYYGNAASVETLALESATQWVLWLALASCGLWLALGAVELVFEPTSRPLPKRQLSEKWKAYLLGAAAALGALGAVPSVLTILSGRPLETAIAIAILFAWSLVALYLFKGNRIGEAVVTRMITAALATLALLLFWAFRHHAALMLIASLIMIGVLMLADENTSSLYSFYRNRLSEAFILATVKQPNLQAPSDHSEVTPYIDDKLPLSAVRTYERGWPYHLLNATVNFPGSEFLDPLRRSAAGFVLSPLFCGSEGTGFVETTRFEGNQMTLAGAMTISAAAVNPNYGLRSRRRLTTILGLLNLRVGVWVEHPKESTGSRRRNWCWPINLALEVFWRPRPGGFINLSDGGHVENLGVFELLRRRCRLIIASDVGADPHHTFGDLGNLISTARIRLGVRIEIDVQSLIPDINTGTSLRQVVMGRILYPKNETEPDYGVFVYVKPALDSTSPVDLRSYRSRHPEFPHEPTANQFFGVAQFEAYRELGYRCGEAMTALISEYQLLDLAKRK